eukprot:4652922-Pyramimonas_sp.AAC.1
MVCKLCVVRYVVRAIGCALVRHGVPFVSHAAKARPCELRGARYVVYAARRELRAERGNNARVIRGNSGPG